MKDELFSPRLTKFLLAVILSLGIFFRLQNFSLLPIDGHPMRQTDTESVAYNFAFTDNNILLPQNSLIRPITNENAYFFLEFPAYEYAIGMFYKVFGWHIEVARIMNLGLFVLAALSLYYFVKKYFNPNTALFCLFYFVFAPASIFFIGHAVHPDVFAVTMLCASLASLMKWKDSRKVVFLVLSISTLALSALTRPFILIALPAILFLLWDLKVKRSVIMMFISLPLILYGLWYYWTGLFRATANVDWENWVFNGKEQLLDRNILLNRLILKNVVGEVMGKIISLIAVIGMLWMMIKRHKRYLFILLWLAAVPLYWLLVPNGNIIHQYYANVYLIPVMIAAGVGTQFLVEMILKRARVLVFPFLAILAVTVVYNGVRTSNYYFADIISSTDQAIGKEIDQNIPQNAKVIYLQGDNSVPFSMYHRKGWMLGYSPMDVAGDANSVLQMKNYGAEYILEPIAANPLSRESMAVIEAKTELTFSSKILKIYKIK